MNRYREFYESIDRVKEYSGGLDGSDQPFYKKIKSCLKIHKLKAPKCLEIGSGNGKLQNVVLDYTGIDIAESLSKFYKKPYYVVSKDGSYPFKDNNFDLIFTNATFEHIPDINRALHEMIRVLKKKGIIIFNPAWNCRSWNADGYPVRPYSDFNLFGKIYKSTIPLRNSLIFRALFTFPKRLMHLFLYMMNKDFYTYKLVYTKIKPNYKKFWMSDSDACNSIDPFLAILFFKSNNFQILNYPSLAKQFFVRTNELILRLA